MVSDAIPESFKLNEAFMYNCPIHANRKDAVQVRRPQLGFVYSASKFYPKTECQFGNDAPRSGGLSFSSEGLFCIV